MDHLPDNKKKDFYLELEKHYCLQYYTATKEQILALDEYVRPLYDETHKNLLLESES